MNIKLAYNFDLESYKTLFPEIQLFSWNAADVSETIDLMVFPGGADVSLEYYLGGAEYRKYVNLCQSDRERDSIELDILDGCYDGRLRVRKILGVCRGMQLINIAFDGSLYPDLDSVQLRHPRIHDIVHTIPNNLDFLTVVNSLHHQGLKSIGTHTRRGTRANGIVLAKDKKDIVPEIITWDDERILGVQFHPEYFDDEFEGKKLFREFCYGWSQHKLKILK